MAVIDEDESSSGFDYGTLSFEGGADSDGFISEYEWTSSLDGFLSSSDYFTTNDMSNGTHTIYFRVKDNLNVWSNYDSITVTMQFFTVITPLSPSNNSQIDSLAPTLSWKSYDDDDHDVTYYVHFGTSESSLSLISSNQTATSCSLLGLTYGQTYYWKVVGNDGYQMELQKYLVSPLNNGILPGHGLTVLLQM